LEPVDHITGNVTLAAHGLQVLASVRVVQEIVHQGKQLMRSGMTLACGARRQEPSQRGGRPCQQAVVRVHFGWRAVRPLEECQVLGQHLDDGGHLVARHLRIAVPKQFHRDWLENKLHRRIMTTMQRLGYTGMQVEYVVAAFGSP
jgi:hypothetical protein